MDDTWWDYVQNVSHSAGPADIAEQTGIPGPTISRWNPTSKGGPARPEPDNVVRFARAYTRSPLEALIRAGYISREDLDTPIDTPVSMSDVPDADFIAELTRRLTEFRRLQLRRDDTQSWPPPGWERQDTGVRRMQDGD